MKELMTLSILIINIFFSYSTFSQDFWTQTNGPSQNRINYILENFNGKIFAATDYTGLFITNNNGDNWQAINYGFTVPHILALGVNQNGNLFAGTFGGGIFRSQSEGNSWVNINSGLQSYWNVYSILTKANGEVIIGTSYGVFRSTNNGDAWFSLTSGSGLDYTYYSIAINDSGYIYAGGNGIFRSVDDGNNWSQILPGRAVKTILINELGYIFVGTIASGGLWRSTDDGVNWDRKNYGFPSSEINITSLVNNTDGYLFAGTESNGVFVSTDIGEEWISLNDGLTDLHIYSLMIKNDGYVFAGSDGNGVYRSSSSTTDVYEMNNSVMKFQLLQNYPNPFNPSTKISWQSPVGSWQTLKVYDILGNEVVTLVDEYRKAGSYEIEFQPTVGSLPTGQAGLQLASGVYYYQLRAGDYVETKKMILMK